MYQLKSLSLNKSGILLRIFCRLTEKVFICFCIDINETFLFRLALMVNHKNILMPRSGGMEIVMKVLLVNGSPHPAGSTFTALNEMEKIFAENGIETEFIHIGKMDIRGCIACGSCRKNGKCIFDDAVNATADAFKECDGIVVGSPVYYASANATLSAFLDRLFYSTPFDKTMKVGAAVVSARRGGLSATFDQLNKYFAISGMPIATSYYWNSIHGNNAGEAVQDKEGLCVMRSLAANMIFLMKSIALGREKYGLPERIPAEKTNFIR